VQIKFASIMVDDQNHALEFDTSVLGFEKMADLPSGTFRWLTVISPDGMAGVELALEPMAFPPARVVQTALFDAEMSATAPITADITAEVARLKARVWCSAANPRSWDQSAPRPLRTRAAI